MDHVIAQVTAYRVVARAARDGVSAIAALHRVGALAGIDGVVAQPAKHRVIAAAGVDRVVASGCVDQVGAKAARRPRPPDGRRQAIGTLVVGLDVRCADAGLVVVSVRITR